MNLCHRLRIENDDECCSAHHRSYQWVTGASLLLMNTIMCSTNGDDKSGRCAGFVENWDEIVINMLKKAPSKKPVLSHYPEALDLNEKRPLEQRPTTTFLCETRWDNDGFIKFGGAIVSKTDVPRLQPFAAAGFVFAEGRLVEEVPFDPHLPFLFDGEEVLYGLTACYLISVFATGDWLSGLL
eukprot:gene20258-7292_t